MAFYYMKWGWGLGIFSNLFFCVEKNQHNSRILTRYLHVRNEPRTSRGGICNGYVNNFSDLYWNIQTLEKKIIKCYFTNSKCCCTRIIQIRGMPEDFMYIVGCGIFPLSCNRVDSILTNHNQATIWYPDCLLLAF